MNIVANTLMMIFWFIVILIPLVVIHEFGHLIMARLNRVKVLEFGVGIPPRWVYRRWKGIIWSINLVLLGGFAKIYGDHDALDEAKEMSKTDPKKARSEYQINRIEEVLASQDLQFFLEENNLDFDADWKHFEKQKGIPKNDQEAKIFESKQNQLETLAGWEYDTKLDSQEAFFNKTWWQQALILLGGVTFNLLAAVFIFFIIYGVIGISNQPVLLEKVEQLRQDANLIMKSDYPIIAGVIKDYPADQVGLKSGDELITFAGKNLQEIKSFDQFRNLVQDNADKDISVTYKSKETGEIKTNQVKLESKDGKTLFGIGGLGYSVDYRAKNIGSAIKMASVDTYNAFVLNYKVLGNVLIALLPNTQDKSALNLVGGPVAVSSLASTIFADYGVVGVLQVMALVSVGLAAFNLIPIPALDGGRLVIITLNKIFRRRNKRIEALAISATFILLLLLGGLIAYNDIVKLASGRQF
jgi:regulator of sigma E protease